jgi:hypothetical protein
MHRCLRGSDGLLAAKVPDFWRIGEPKEDPFSETAGAGRADFLYTLASVSTKRLKTQKTMPN